MWGWNGYGVYSSVFPTIPLTLATPPYLDLFLRSRELWRISLWAWLPRQSMRSQGCYLAASMKVMHRGWAENGQGLPRAFSWQHLPILIPFLQTDNNSNKWLSFSTSLSFQAPHLRATNHIGVTLQFLQPDPQSWASCHGSAQALGIPHLWFSENCSWIWS